MCKEALCETPAVTALCPPPCRNCGNVFCASCCDQKIPVPSQQLFEPSRVCKTCYSNLRLNSTPLDLELEKPITASSNWGTEERGGGGGRGGGAGWVASHWHRRAAEEEHRSYTECPMYFVCVRVCACTRTADMELMCIYGRWCVSELPRAQWVVCVCVRAHWPHRGEGWRRWWDCTPRPEE